MDNLQFPIFLSKMEKEWQLHPQFDGVSMISLDVENGEQWRRLAVKVEPHKGLSAHTHTEVLVISLKSTGNEESTIKRISVIVTKHGGALPH